MLEIKTMIKSHSIKIEKSEERFALRMAVIVGRRYVGTTRFSWQFHDVGRTPKKITADPKTDGIMTSHFLFRHYTNRISRRLPTAFA